MCGIAGAFSPSGDAAPSALRDYVERSQARLVHRGPDSSGSWVDPDVPLALGHRRLAILDITPQGYQPMASRDGRFVVVYNGEIYNFEEIGADLRRGGALFEGESDTEVLIEAISAWGVVGAIERARGMFAFAVWDRRTRALHLARDRMGEKPLYYGWVGSDFVFASELGALRAHPGWKGVIDRDALVLYLRHGYVPGPWTIYRGIRKLGPGKVLRVRDGARPGTLAPEPYWKLPPPSRPASDVLSDRDAVNELEALLAEVVERQMVADVPLGAFLSGGVDSSTVVALMQAVSTRSIRTFTIGVRDPNRDEAPAARAIADALRTDHTERYVHVEDVLAVVPRLGEIYDEPFADSSQIPTYLVSALARESVTVSLSGDGGDELFAGYRRYVGAPALVGRIGRVPGPLRSAAGRALLSPPVLAGLDALGHGLVGERTRRLGEVLTSRSPLGLHRALHSNWPRPSALVHGGDEPQTLFTASALPWRTDGFGHEMLVADARTYLPDDLLVKVDRAAMAVSLETRVPLLDHRLVEFAMGLPWRMKVRDGVQKWVLRQVLYRYVPRRLVDGPKRGFATPIGDWLRGPLKQWADGLLDPDRLHAEGFFAPELITRRWRQHLGGAIDWSYPIWTVLMFQQWYASQAASCPADPDR